MELILLAIIGFLLFSKGGSYGISVSPIVGIGEGTTGGMQGAPGVQQNMTTGAVPLASQPNPTANTVGIIGPVSTLRIGTEIPVTTVGRQTSGPENGGTFFPPPAPIVTQAPAPTVYRNPITGFQFTAATAKASKNGFIKMPF